MTEESREAGSPVLRLALRVVGGLAVIAISFFVTLYALDYMDRRNRDAVRGEHIAQIRSAVEAYYKARGAFPALDDKPVENLKATLVDGGFLKSIPVDPLWATTNKEYRYYSDGKNYFGLLAWLEQAHGPIPAGGTCLAGRGTKGSGLWGQPPDCPF
jgi:hypothetical protein